MKLTNLIFLVITALACFPSQMIAGTKLIPNEARPGMKLKADLKAIKFANEKQVQNPTSLAIDEKGRLFVTETWRAGQNGVYGNRSHTFWLLDDNAAQKTEDRMRLLEKWKHKRDYSQHKDVSEIVKLLEDTNGDGIADSAKVFADGFNHPLDGIASGIFAFNGKVYFSCIPNIWELKDENNDGKADHKKVLQEGFGVRFSFWGHDLNGFKLGPDGRLYFTVGDRGYNITTKEGRNFADPGSGAVFRCELDGSNMEVFYHRLRNPKELAFDKYGFLFTGDNNGDMGDRARLVYVLEQGTTGWHNGMQFMHSFYRSTYPKDKIGHTKAWNDERIWDLQAKNKRAYHLPPIAHISNGPTGFTYNPGNSLNSNYKDTFFLVDYRGGASRSRIISFQLESTGASFKVINESNLLQGMAATDVEFGLDGELYVSDYIGGWGLPKKGNIFKISSLKTDKTPKNINDNNSISVREIFSKGFTAYKADELISMLEHSDSRVRIRSSIELSDRQNVNSLSKASLSENSTKGMFAAMHATWGLGMLNRQGNEAANTKLISLLEHANSHVQRIAITALGESKTNIPQTKIETLLNHNDPHLVTATGIALSKIGSTEVLTTILKLIEKNNNRDVFLRHGLIMALSGAGESKIAELNTHKNKSVRLAAVVALFHLKSKFLSKFIKDEVPAIAEEAIFAMKDLSIALDEIASLVSEKNIVNYSPLTQSRILNANNILGKKKNAENLLLIASREDIKDDIKLMALDLIQMWETPRKIDKSSGLFVDLQERKAEFVKRLTKVVQEGLARESSSVCALLIKCADTYEIKLNDDDLLAQLLNKKNDTKLRLESLNSLYKSKGKELMEALMTLTRENSEVALTAINYIANDKPEFAIEKLADYIKSKNPKFIQLALTTLGSLNHPKIKGLLNECLILLKNNKFPKSAYLELFDLAAKYNRKQEITDFRENSQSKANLRSYLECMDGGDAIKGEEYFKSHPTAQCFRCHKVNRKGGDVGPDLSVIGKKDVHYLLESLVEPGAVVTPGFGIISVTTNDGKTISGAFIKEDKKQIEVKVEKKIHKILKSEIKVRTTPVSAMPPIALIVKKNEIRDIMAYLKTLQSRKRGH